jgi:hypothetical protein
MRGLNILLVVIGHAHLIDLSTGTPFTHLDAFNSILVPIRMPLFIFCSGGLLYLSRISKGWSVASLYRDKSKRILCPFVFFVILYYLVKMAMNAFVKTKVDYSVADFLLSFAIYSNHPSVHLWFLAVLMWFMLMYPLFKWLCKSDKLMILFWLFCFGIYFIDTEPDSNHNYFFIFTLNHYLIYFFSGIFFFRFHLYEYINGILTTALLAGMYIAAYVLELWILSSLVGVLAVISLCRVIASYVPNLFSSFREYIYQIYLLSLLFQGIIELLVWRKMFYYPNAIVVFYILNIVFGIYLPVITSKLIERTPCRFLHLIFGLKRVAGKTKT